MIERSIIPRRLVVNILVTAISANSIVGMSVCDSPNLQEFSYSTFNILASTQSNMTGNILLSPYSIASALALTLAGCTPSSPCQTQIENALGISSHTEIATARKKLSTSRLSSEDEGEVNGVELIMANSIWTSSKVKEDYVTLVEETHDATAKPLPKNYQTIDNWISEKTKGMLKNVLSGDVDPLTVALLVSAIRFKGTWARKFDVNKTKAGDFHLFEGVHKKRVDYMHAKEKMEVLPYVEELGGASVIRLFYKNDDFYALFILPKENTPKSMRDAIEGLVTKGGQLLDNLATFPRRDVNLTLPRFKISYGTVSLKNTLQQIGIKMPFGDREEKDIFSVMSSDPDVHLDDVLHKVVLEVNEEGTTAAAATVAKIMTRSMPPPPVHVTFDRPFLMSVMGPGAVPLFIGRIVDLEAVHDEEDL
eukprot:CAMPEP_0172497056 /NCGR_PEP_ID=MMETSP1066-20121228/94772_1 /TAXON_ID=671091 /ORGANISM="Coscinodiscus wailesii, Strain CCMP2513" /LENGTH=420 /DNA_ID=CAMNT_0013269631 /DNA_START=180 /DNA_END=1442 /DNA_ORIENTATION=+